MENFASVMYNLYMIHVCDLKEIISSTCVKCSKYRTRYYLQESCVPEYDVTVYFLLLSL